MDLSSQNWSHHCGLGAAREPGSKREAEAERSRYQIDCASPCYSANASWLLFPWDQLSCTLCLWKSMSHKFQAQALGLHRPKFMFYPETAVAMRMCRYLTCLSLRLLIYKVEQRLHRFVMKIKQSNNAGRIKSDAMLLSV